MKIVAGYLWYILIIAGAILSLYLTACQKDASNDDPDIYGKWVDPADGTVYRTLELGDQIWMADNINRGEMIAGNREQEDNGVIEKYCYDNNPVLCEKYGGLYQWEEAMQYSTTESSQGICPEGWHIPSDSEWKILEIFLGMPADAAGEILWRGSNQGRMIQPGGETGFDALRGGNRFLTGSFNQLGSTGYFWTSTMAEGNHAWRRGVGLEEDGIYRSVNHKTFGFPVRCIKY